MLSRAGFDTPALDAKLLVGHALGLDALGLFSRENDAVTPEAQAQAEALLARRLTGLSVARIIGHKEFYGLEFALSPATLEPRPDTELLVDLALPALGKGGRLLDMGTGTGCIPIAILANRPDATAIATDLNPSALDMARQNATSNGVAERLEFRRGDWFGALLPADGRFDLIVSNPPYIASHVVENLSVEVREFDPRLALDGGPDGLAPYRIIAREAGDWLERGGAVMVEIGYDQGEAVSALFGDAGYGEIRVHKDLAGLDRVVCAHHLMGA